MELTNVSLLQRIFPDDTADQVEDHALRLVHIDERLRIRQACLHMGVACGSPRAGSSCSTTQGCPGDTGCERVRQRAARPRGPAAPPQSQRPRDCRQTVRRRLSRARDARSLAGHIVGGAGFVGSHFSDALLAEPRARAYIVVPDDDPHRARQHLRRLHLPAYLSPRAAQQGATAPASTLSPIGTGRRCSSARLAGTTLRSQIERVALCVRSTSVRENATTRGNGERGDIVLLEHVEARPTRDLLHAPLRVSPEAGRSLGPTTVESLERRDVDHDRSAGLEDGRHCREPPASSWMCSRTLTMKTESNRSPAASSLLKSCCLTLTFGEPANRSRRGRHAQSDKSIARQSGGDAPPRGVPRAPRGERIDAVLFNGGAMTPASLRAARDRSDRALAGRARRASSPRRCPSSRSRRAPRTTAWSAAASRRGSRAARRARSTSASRPATRELAVCLAPAGLEDGARVQLARDFQLVTNRPVSFRLYSSSSRHDAAGRARADRRRPRRDDRRRQRSARAAADRHRAARARPRPRSPCGSRSTSPSSARSRSRASIATQGETWKLAFDMRSGGAAHASRAADAAPHPKADEAKARLAARVHDRRRPRRR